MSWHPEADLFVETLVIDQMDPEREADTVAGIVAEHGLDPEDYLYRGVAMPDSVRGLHANGHDYPPEHFNGTVWAMGIEVSDEGHSYTGICADLQGLTPLSYVMYLTLGLSQFTTGNA